MRIVYILIGVFIIGSMALILPKVGGGLYKDIVSESDIPSLEVFIKPSHTRVPSNVLLDVNIVKGEISDRKLKSVKWYLGDTFISSNKRFNYILKKSGEYIFSVVVITESGRELKESKSVVVENNILPVCSNLEPSETYVNITTLFKADCYDPDGRIVKVVYDPGDGTPLKNSERHIYKNSGVYTYRLIVYDDSNEYSLFSKKISVY